MRRLLKDQKGLTLAELLIASGLMGVIAAAAGAVAGMLYRANNDIKKDFMPMTQANLTIEAVYQRVLRAPPIALGGAKVPFLILDGGHALAYKSSVGPGNDEIRQVADKVMLRPSGQPQETLMHGVKSIGFRTVPSNRLGIDVILSGDQGAVSSSVFPRNSRAPQQIIN